MKKLIWAAGILVLLLMLYNGIQSIFTLIHKKDLVVQASRKLQEQERQNKELREKKRLVDNPRFIEEEARNKLFLVKEGESQIVGPTSSPSSSLTVRSSKKPNWQEWLELFF